MFRQWLRPRRFFHLQRGYSGSGNAITLEVVDLRSDTLTSPSSAMRAAMAEAKVGDDTYDRDPTVQALEERVGDLLGKESAMFVISGTMSNLLAVLTHCQRRTCEAFVGDKSHMFLCEQGSMAHIAGVHSNVMPNAADGTFDLEDLRSRMRHPGDPHEPISSLICVENSHGGVGGRALSIDWLFKLYQVASIVDLPVHCDGARLLNAAIAIGEDASHLVRGCSSINLCLSKGIGAPAGSVLAGSKEFIAQARRLRKGLGGSARQIGGLAAAAMVALDTAKVKMARDHEHATMIAKGVSDCSSLYISVDVTTVDTNIIFVHTKCISAQKLQSRLQRVTPEEVKALGFAVMLRCFTMEEHILRLVTHCDVSPEQVEKACKKLKFVIKEIDAIMASY